MDSVLKSQLKRDEGKRNKVYKDSKGNCTIGYGHKDNDLDPMTYWSDEECDYNLDLDIEYSGQVLVHNLPWVTGLSGARRRVLHNMTFNMGIGKVILFKKTLYYIQSGYYSAAADEMLDSLWATQVGDRAKRLSKQMKFSIDQ